MRRLLVLLLVLVMTPLPAVIALDDGLPGTQTIMVYMVGSDLEPKWHLGTGDLLEMLSARHNRERVTVLAMTGGTNKWHAPSIPVDKLSIFEVAGSSPRLVHSMDSASMGEADTLLAFMDYAVENHPADSYGFVFWDHGAGPMEGIGVDILYENDSLTLKELESAFSRSPFRAGKRLEWLAFDACLMASLEVASMMAPYARYMIASEETLPGYGIDYDFLTEFSNSDLSGLSAGRAIIEYTANFYEQLKRDNPQQENLVTLSLMDLDRVGPAQDALDGLFQDLQHGLEVAVYSDIARRRDGSKAYGRVASSFEWDLIDLADLASNMEGLYPRQAGQVIEAIEGLVLENYANVPRSRGVSLYFPLLNKRSFSTGWAEIYQEFDFTPAYRAFVQQFGAILLADSLGQWTGSETPVVTYDEQTGEYYIQLSEEQAQHYVRAEYYVLQQLYGEEYRLAHTSSDVTLDAQRRVHANFDGRLMAIFEEGDDTPILPYMKEKENIDGVATYQIPALLTRQGADLAQEVLSADLIAEISKAEGWARVTGAIRREEVEGNQQGKKDVALYEWDSVYLPYTSFYLTRGLDGAPLPVGDWVLSDSLHMATLPADRRIDVRLEPLRGDQSEYFVIISIVDSQGFVYSSELMPLTGFEGLDAPAGSEEAPETLTVDFPLYSAPVTLFGDEHIQVSLKTIEFSGQQSEPRRAPDTAHVRLELVNTGREGLSVAMDWASVNEFMMDTPASVFLSSGGTEELSLDLPIAPVAGQTSMLEAGIRLVERIGLQLSWQTDDRFQAKTLGSRAVEINTVFAVGAGYEVPRPADEDIQVLAEEYGFTIERYGTPFVADGVFHVPLRIGNRSDRQDYLQLDMAAINGIMAPIHLNLPILPGKTRHALLSIDTHPTILPEDMSQFQYLFDGINNLESMGVSEVADIWLRLIVDRQSEMGKSTLSRSRRSLEPIEIIFDEAYEQALDTEGTVLFSGGGVSVVRLDSDPTGQKLYIRNSTGRPLRLSTFDITTVDGVSYSENTAVLQLLGPGHSAYTELFSYLPGIYPQGDILETRFVLIDLEQNSMVLRSEPVAFRLHP